MILGGIQPFTTIDYPNKLAAVFFSKGCPLRCPYCQNPSLQQVSNKSDLAWSIAEQFMKSRKGLLDAVVFSGGEPLIQYDLKEAMLYAKENGFLVGLHTSGVSLSAFERVISVVDWVGLDVKTCFDLYNERLGCSGNIQTEQCLDLLLKLNKDFEVRTTLDPRVISVDELMCLAKCLSNKGVKTFAIQEYHAFPEAKEIPDSIQTKAYFKDDVLKKIECLFENFIVRRSGGI